MKDATRDQQSTGTISILKVKETLLKIQKVLVSNMYKNKKLENKSLQNINTVLNDIGNIFKNQRYIGASLWIDEIRQLVNYIEHQKSNERQSAVKLICQSVHKFVPYIEGLYSGRNASSIVVLPILNSCRELRKEKPLHEFQLFHKEVQLNSNWNEMSKIKTEQKKKLLSLLTKISPIYNECVKNLVRKKDYKLSIKKMHVLSEKLANNLPETSYGLIWTLMLVVVESLDLKSDMSSLAKRVLVKSIDELNNLISFTGFENDNSTQERLVKELLYYIATLNDKTKLVMVIKNKYRLDKVFPSNRISFPSNKKTKEVLKVNKVVDRSVNKEKVDYFSEGSSKTNIKFILRDVYDVYSFVQKINSDHGSKNYGLHSINNIITHLIQIKNQLAYLKILNVARSIDDAVRLLNRIIKVRGGEGSSVVLNLVSIKMREVFNALNLLNSKIENGKKKVNNVEVKSSKENKDAFKVIKVKDLKNKAGDAKGRKLNNSKDSEKRIRAPHKSKKVAKNTKVTNYQHDIFHQIRVLRNTVIASRQKNVHFLRVGDSVHNAVIEIVSIARCINVKVIEKIYRPILALYRNISDEGSLVSTDVYDFLDDAGLMVVDILKVPKLGKVLLTSKKQAFYKKHEKIWTASGSYWAKKTNIKSFSDTQRITVRVVDQTIRNLVLLKHSLEYGLHLKSSNNVLKKAFANLSLLKHERVNEQWKAVIYTIKEAYRYDSDSKNINRRRGRACLINKSCDILKKYLSAFFNGESYGIKNLNNSEIFQSMPAVKNSNHPNSEENAELLIAVFKHNDDTNKEFFAWLGDSKNNSKLKSLVGSVYGLQKTASKIPSIPVNELLENLIELYLVFIKYNARLSLTYINILMRCHMEVEIILDNIRSFGFSKEPNNIIKELKSLKKTLPFVNIHSRNDCNHQHLYDLQKNDGLQQHRLNQPHQDNKSTIW